MANIKLFVCCHQKTFVPEHPLLVPIQVGAALSKQRFPGFLHDDTGENISEKNRSYCELTAQYWAWKNIEADYYGFFHYRRYLYPGINAKRPYRIEREPSLSLLDKLGYNDFIQTIQQYDIIVPKTENMHTSIRSHYTEAPYHHADDLELVEQIVCSTHPEMVQPLEKYFSSTLHYFGNIYIMRRETLQDYCGWLFPILGEFDYRKDTTTYSPQEKRVDGYLAERLLGVYVTSQRDRFRTLELPRVHFLHGKDYAKQRLAYTVLPPGSKRRAVIKKLLP